jgi:hypothetical protein
VRGREGGPFGGALLEALDRCSAPEGIGEQRPDLLGTSLQTAADGRFAFPFLAAGMVEVRVRTRWRKKPVLSAYRAFDAKPGAVLTWDPLLEERSIRGRLVDDLGQPLAGWCVSAAASCRVPGMEGTVTDGNGLFALGPCADVAYVVRCQMPDWGPTIHEEPGVVPGPSSITLVVPRSRQPSARITGTVRDAAGGPLGGIQVFLLEDRGQYSEAELRPGGRFESRLLLPGAYRVQASHAERGGLALGRHTVVAGQALDLGTARFARPGSLELTVVNARGEPWSGWLYLSQLADGHCHWLEVQAGKLTFRALAPRSYAFSSASRPPLCFAPPPVEILAGETTLVRLEECAGGWRRLRYPTAGRAPLAVSTSIRDASGQVRRVWTSRFWRDEDVDHDIQLPFGSYLLETRTADGKSATTPFEVTAAEAPPPVAVRLP